MRSVRIWPNSGASPRRGAKVVEGLAPELDTLPEAARLPIEVRLGQLADIRARVDRLTGETEAAHRNSEVSLRLAAIQGVGMLTATAVAATTPDGSTFASARDDAAWLGRTPKPHSTGGKPRSGRISRMGNRYIRRLLYLGAMSLIMARRRRGPGVDWLWQKIATKRTRVVAIAVGNRKARTAWREPSSRSCATARWTDRGSRRRRRARGGRGRNQAPISRRMAAALGLLWLERLSRRIASPGCGRGGSFDLNRFRRFLSGFPPRLCRHRFGHRRVEAGRIGGFPVKR